AQNAWLGQHKAIRAELVEFDGQKFEVGVGGADADAGRFDTAGGADVTARVRAVAEACGLREVRVTTEEDANARGPARWRRAVTGVADPATPYKVAAIETRRTSSRPAPPFITSTLQQAASSRLGFAAQRTM